MAVHLHRAPRTDRLAEDLGGLLSTPLADPFAEEVVVVPARGVERWLTQRLSHRLGAGPRGGDGVCAGVRFLQPRSLVSLLLGRDREDPWDPERLVWPLLATIDASLDEPWCTTLAAHLGHGLTGPDADLRSGRRYSVAIRLASLFASYAVQRPQLVADWREGRDTDGAGGQVADDLAWQPELWRRLLDRVDAEPPDVRHARVVAALEADRDPHGDGLDLPPRLSLFGHTRIPVTEVALLRALGRHRDVHLFLPQPSPALWDALAGLDGPAGVVARDDDTSADLVGHPLLASLGRDARELRRTLDPLVADPVVEDPVVEVRGAPAPSLETPAPEQGGDTISTPQTLLGWLQADLRANHAPTAAERAGRTLADDDRSLQVHACHGSARQVDVLREVLVGLLEDDPTLEPRDILVMCPDIETYAPLISAGFGLAPAAGGSAEDVGHPAHLLRVRLADRALTSTNPLLAIAGSLLELSGGRVTASEVLDLAATDACRRRFGFSDDDLDRISRWVAASGVRWGLDGRSRASFRMDGFEHNTWRAGLDRVLLGVAMSGDGHRHLGRGLPLDDVGSSEIDLAGRLAELLDRLGACLAGLQAATTVEEWTDRLRRGVRSLTDVGPDDAWQLPQFERELARTAASAADREVALRLPDVRALVQSRLAGRPTRANFRTGTLTVCTMVPMRSVPHRVVCLVGLDDGVFPRSRAVDGDDVLGRRPLTGERDARSEDRQLLLDALLAATEHVVITYTGANEHSGARRPPAVPLGEILDAADRTTAAPVRDRIHTRHPLQPYDARNLKAGDPAADPAEWADPELRGPQQRPFSFDRAALAGARAAVGPRHEPPPLLTAPLPPRPADDVSLADLKAFLMHPVRAFLRSRLDVGTPLEPDELGDAIPVGLDALEVWQIGDQLLREVLAGGDPTAVMTAVQLSGSLPPGGLGQAALHGVVEECQKLLSSTAEIRRGERRSLDVDVDLGGGRRLTGTVAGVHESRIVSLGYSRLKPKQRLQVWVDLLALSASRPDDHWTAHAVGRERAGPKRALSGPLDHRAADWLRELVALRDRGLTEPLPLPVLTGAAWAEARLHELMGSDASPLEAARRAWETDPHNRFGIEGEDADASHQRVYGRGAPIGRLVEAGLPDLAWQVWEPLLTGGEKVGPL
ncbi:exodeoxyribonuclease V subunit gamma [Nocardioides sp. GCM10027113]|uniref:exodeoxyribonuclease V subunit gamma n=1 Tax=unclassified Nocardioides TaxID=2615069 RepID=UPI003605E534